MDKRRQDKKKKKNTNGKKLMQYLRTSTVIIETWLKKFNGTQEFKHQIVPSYKIVLSKHTP